MALTSNEDTRALKWAEQHQHNSQIAIFSSHSHTEMCLMKCHGNVMRNSAEHMENREQRGLIIMSLFPTGLIMKIDWTGKKLFYFFLQHSLKIDWVWHLPAIIFPSFSSQSNWYDMNAGNCNLLLIKTCCWRWLLTDDNSELSCSQVSSSPLSCFSFLPPTLPPSYFSLCFPLALYWIAFLYYSLTTMKRKREPYGEKSLSSTTTSWRRRSPSISWERTMWVPKTASSITGCHKSEL